MVESMQMTVELNELDLLARMKNFEDHLVERKTVGDSKDWRKTAVAFANSAPIGLPAVLYIGVKNSGEIETPQRDLDEAQKKFNSQMGSVYPRIAYIPKIIAEDGRQVLAVIVPGSDLRPHFSGLSYVRRGSESIEASETQFDEFIARRSAKAEFILRYKGQIVNAIHRGTSQGGWSGADTSAFGDNKVVVAECNQFFVTFQTSNGTKFSFPLSRVEINFDHERNKLQLEIQC